MISKDNLLDQVVTESTRITEDTENILELFFCNNQSLIIRAEVIPGISDRETVYVESSLRPTKAVTPPRTVHQYHKADFESIKTELRHIQEDFVSMEPTSTTQELWDKFCSTVSSLMKKYIQIKTLKGNKINRKVKSLMPRRDKLFRRKKKTKK